jgi:hypothetical protein
MWGERTSIDLYCQPSLNLKINGDIVHRLTKLKQNLKNNPKWANFLFEITCSVS